MLNRYRLKLPTHCEECGTLLEGCATIHTQACSWYPISYYAVMHGEGRTLDLFEDVA